MSSSASPEPVPLPYKTSVPKGLKEQPMYRWSGSGMAHRDKSIMLKKDIECVYSDWLGVCFNNS